MLKVVSSDGHIWEVVKRPPQTPYIHRLTRSSNEGSLGLAIGGTVGGIAGYLLGKKHGYNDGYNQARAEDEQLLAQYLTQIQNKNWEIANLQTQNSRLSQENGSLRKENEILKALLRQQPSTPEAEAILQTLKRVEFQLTQTLPPIFEDGEDHDIRQN